ncbi:MAG: hypothetical protein NDF55_04570 [archaeon GB-1867-005]|nr:hypothetical protein [Candidatus Culexmicrobium cathedralense]
MIATFIIEVLRSRFKPHENYWRNGRFWIGILQAKKHFRLNCILGEEIYGSILYKPWFVKPVIATSMTCRAVKF